MLLNVFISMYQYIKFGFIIGHYFILPVHFITISSKLLNENSVYCRKILLFFTIWNLETVLAKVDKSGSVFDRFLFRLRQSRLCKYENLLSSPFLLHRSKILLNKSQP